MDIEFAYDTLSVVESSHGGILAIYLGHEYMKAYEGVHHIDMRCSGYSRVGGERSVLLILRRIIQQDSRRCARYAHFTI